MYTAAFAALLGAATGQVTQDPAGVALPYDPATGDNFFALLGETCVDAQGRQMRGRWDNQFAGGRDACRDHCGNSGFYGPNRCTGFDYGGGSTSCFLFGPGMDEPNANGVPFSGDSPSPPSYHGGPVPVRAENPNCDDVANGCRVCWMATPPPLTGCTDATADNYNAWAVTDDPSSCLWTDGCTDAGAQNYDAAATRDDDSCICAGFKEMQHNRQVCSTCSGDMDGDLKVTAMDILLLLGDFGLCDPRLISDATNDGCVGIQDLLLLLPEFGRDCSACESPDFAPWTVCGNGCGHDLINMVDQQWQGNWGYNMAITNSVGTIQVAMSFAGASMGLPTYI